EDVERFRAELETYLAVERKHLSGTEVAAVVRLIDQLVALLVAVGVGAARIHRRAAWGGEGRRDEVAVVDGVHVVDARSVWLAHDVDPVVIIAVAVGVRLGHDRERAAGVKDNDAGEVPSTQNLAPDEAEVLHRRRLVDAGEREAVPLIDVGHTVVLFDVALIDGWRGEVERLAPDVAAAEVESLDLAVQIYLQAVVALVVDRQGLIDAGVLHRQSLRVGIATACRSVEVAVGHVRHSTNAVRLVRPAAVERVVALRIR